MRRTCLFILLFVNVTARAQNEPPELITDRPDQTESAATVPHRSLQIETGFVMAKDETDQFKNWAFAYNTTLLRYGLLENFELRLGSEYLGEKMKYKQTDVTTSSSGLGPLYTGFKVKIHEEEGWKPEVALLGGLLLPFTASEDFKPEHTGGGLRFAFSHTLSDRLSLGYNLGAEWFGETAIPTYFYSVSLGAGISDGLGVFIESFGLIPEEGEAGHMLDAGLTFLLLPNFQLDASGGFGIHNSIDHFISLGLTYRFPG